MNIKLIGIAASFILAIIVLLLPEPEGMSPAAWKTTSVALLMAVLWISEAIPLYATALLPIVLFPVLQISSIKDSTAPFGHPLIFLFLGGFLLAQGIQKWGLHKRIALRIIDFIGASPRKIIAGFMIGSAFLSMWISNTATALMMLPIGLSVIGIIKSTSILSWQEEKKFAVALLLSIAYSCSIGGVATLIGTPPNAFMAAYMLESYGINIGFAEWMLFGLPFTLLSLPIAFFIMTRFLFVFKHDSSINIGIIEDEISRLGKITREERIIQLVFLLTALLWIFRPLITNFIPGLSDTSIAIFGALILFFIPAGKDNYILEWKDAKQISWGILILFGGGLSLAEGIKNSGLSEWIAVSILNIGDIPILFLIVMLTAAIIFLTEITSNMATTAAFLPIIASIGVAMGVDPLVLVVPATVAASCAFMLPVATPPNAIVFSSSELTIKNMTRAGIFLNIVYIAVIVILSHLLGSLVFGY